MCKNCGFDACICDALYRVDDLGEPCTCSDPDSGKCLRTIGVFTSGEMHTSNLDDPDVWAEIAALRVYEAATFGGGAAPAYKVKRIR